jgi:hypothetical protein
MDKPKRKAAPEVRRILQLAGVIKEDGILPDWIDDVEVRPDRVEIVRGPNAEILH